MKLIKSLTRALLLTLVLLIALSVPAFAEDDLLNETIVIVTAANESSGMENDPEDTILNAVIGGVNNKSLALDDGLSEEQVSLSSTATEGNGESFHHSISADGRYVAFTSHASNLAPYDTNGYADVFVRDRLNGWTTRVSVASDGTQGNGMSIDPSISDDGRYVKFDSNASNLVPGDTNGCADVFVHDRQTGMTTRVSIGSHGTPEGNLESYDAQISGNGMYVAFFSKATNLVLDDTNTVSDIFVHDRVMDMTTRVSVASDGTEGNGDSWSPTISADGRYVAYSSTSEALVLGDTNTVRDIFVHDRQTRTTTRVSVASDGTQGLGTYGSDNPSISADGRYIAFDSDATNMIPAGDTNGKMRDVFVHDKYSATTKPISIASDGTQGNNDSHEPSVSDDSRYAEFGSYASNLVSDDTNGEFDIFVHDLWTRTTTRVSIASDGTQGNDAARGGSISGDGRYVAFSSDASNLVPGDTNGCADVFVHDLLTGETTRVSVPSSVICPIITISRNGEWYLDICRNFYWDGEGTDQYRTFGMAGDKGITGDWNGDGLDEIGVFRNGELYLDINRNYIWDGVRGDWYRVFGIEGDIPVTGDWNNDGADEIGVFRNGEWYFDLNGNFAWDGLPWDVIVYFGFSTDKPVVGDWNLDGYPEIGVFRNGEWYLDLDQSGSWSGTRVDWYRIFGMTGDTPVVGDWNVDGLDEIGVFRNGEWYLDMDRSYSWSGTTRDWYRVFGIPGDTPRVLAVDVG